MKNIRFGNGQNVSMTPNHIIYTLRNSGGVANSVAQQIRKIESFDKISIF